MSAEQIQINLTPALYRQFMRLKTQSQFENDEDLLQACFESLERDEERKHRQPGASNPVREPYMSRPALSLEDYDT